MPPTPATAAHDLDAARKREAATREILDLISRSRDDEAPVFDAILHRAADLCGAFAAALVLGKAGDAHQRLVAHYGVNPTTVALYDRGEVPMDPDASFAARAITTGKVVHVEDMMDTAFYRQGVGLYVSIVRDSGIRTEMQVPLLTPAGGIGAFVIFRKDVRPYTPDEIALVETFAAQAVIAIENVRQFREVQTRLAREAAMREILEVISQSRDDDRPVFDAVLQSAQGLCGADAAALLLGRAGGPHLTLAALQQDNFAKADIEGFIAAANQPPMRMDPALHASAQAICSGQVVHIVDLALTPGYLSGETTFRFMVEDQGLRTTLSVPLFDAHGTIGAISLHRREVRLFSADEVALIQSFAAQAVIAIENVRQFRELQTRLAREAATREILEVISQSRDDDKPVFDVVLRKAAELCHAPMASLVTVSEDRSHSILAADWGFGYISDVFPVGGALAPLDSDYAHTTCIREGRVVHLEDLADSDLYRSGDLQRTSMVDQEGLRTFLAVPLFSGGRTVGCILVFRREVAPFKADEIALLETFAAQAVIAIENVRQFRELQTRLEREAATRDILEVISQSRDDDAPVFDVIVRNAARLCNAPMAWLMLAVPAPRTIMLAGYHGLSRRQIELGDVFELDAEPDKITAVGRAIFGAQTIQDEDLALTTHYLNDIGDMRMLVDEEGIRTRLCVPLVSGGVGIGAILLTRREVAPFTPDEVTLVETFAAQAVIAIENVRQFRELQDSLKQQEATSDILRVISQSREDETQVFDLILEKAAVLCDADQGSLIIVNEARTHIRLMADWGHNRTAWQPGSEFSLDLPLSIVATIRTAKVVHIEDYSQSVAYKDRDPIAVGLVETEGHRTRLIVPLLQNGIAIGCISLSRRTVRPFTADEIALVETFAAQAVIAIENVRQFRELQVRLAREAATREILEVISQSRDDDRPVFDVVLRKAADLCNASLASLLITSEDRSHAVLVADRGLGQVQGLIQVGTTVWPMESGYAPSTCMREGRIVHIHDIADTDLYRSGDPLRVAAVEEDGIRTFLAVPLFSGGQTAGCILVYRREVRPFAPDEIALVETFAAQAVIAIENVRQFRELQDRLAREEATRQILQVISQSRDDETPVFDAILERAERLCDAPSSALLLVDDARTHLALVATRGMRSRTAIGEIHPITSGHTSSDAVLTGSIAHVHDVRETELYRNGDPLRIELVEQWGLRTSLAVPLISNGKVIGAFTVMRLHKVSPFSDNDIRLLEAFAAQAVIAIENVRQFRELQTRLAREAATREILEVISRNPDDDRPVFDAILGNAIRLCGADTSSLILGRRDDPRMKLVAWRDKASSSAVHDDAMIAKFNATDLLMDPAVHISAQVICDERKMQVLDVLQTEGYLSGEPSYLIQADTLGVRTALLIPLIDARGALGVVHVHRREVRAFSDDEIALLETFAAQAVIAIENVRQFKALEALNAELGDRVQEQVGEIERMGRLKRFLPAAVADAVVSSGSEKMLKSHRALLGVLFCDIRGFTAFCETAEPEETIEVLQTYHEEMGKLINAHGAGVDHRMGDGIMVLFNDPLPCDDPAGSAVRLAMAMRARMAELCGKWKRMGHRLGFGLGVSLGYATVGMVGSGGRFDYTASGTAINLAARLCDEALDGEILISPRTRMAVEDDFTVESRGEISFKGIREPVEVFCVTGVVGA